MDVDQLYAALVAGEATEIPPELVGQLSDKARRTTISPDAEARLAATRVALALPPAHGVSVAMALVRDPDVRIRRRSVNIALKAQAEGLPVLRRLTADPDEGLAMAVLDLLIAAVDAASAGMARELLRDPRGSIRARGAALAGAAGGPGLLVDLRKVAGDPDPGVRNAVDEAIAMLTGKTDRPPAGRWWERDPLTDESSQAAPPPPFVPPTAPAAPAAPAPEPAAAPAPAPPTDPAALPTDATGLVARLGQVAPGEREPIVEALRALPAADLQNLVQRWRPGGDPNVGRGLALAAAALDKQAWAQRLQPMLADTQAPVRAAAVEAIGKMGGLSTIPWVTAVLKDPDPAVVIAAATAVGALCARFQRGAMARQWLASLTADARPGVADAAKAALAAAGA
jgi:HEAT repeat protein